jgi:hypothetical protein
MSYGVIEKPCPDCDGQGYTRLRAFDNRTGLTYDLEINCGRCFATGWIEEYGHGGEGSSDPVEIPDPPDSRGAGGRPLALAL